MSCSLSVPESPNESFGPNDDAIVTSKHFSQILSESIDSEPTFEFEELVRGLGTPIVYISPFSSYAD